MWTRICSTLILKSPRFLFLWNTDSIEKSLSSKTLLDRVHFALSLFKSRVSKEQSNPNLVPMASELEIVWEGGQVAAAPPMDDGASDAGKSTKSRSTRAPTSKASAPGGPAGRGKAVMLSSSFSTWSKCPETWVKIRCCWHVLFMFVGPDNSYLFPTVPIINHHVFDKWSPILFW